MKAAIMFVTTSVILATAGCGDDTGDGGSTTGAGGQGSGGEAAGGTGGTGGTGTGGIGGGGLLPFGADCTDNEECESGLCYPFGMGPKCTVECPADPEDCPGPLKECNNMAPAACKV